MRRIPRIALTLLLGAVLLLTWSRAHSRLRKSNRPPAGDDAALQLSGTLEPIVTTPINARNLALSVPLYSWVVKGQVIGEADFELTPEQLTEAHRALDAADAAVAREQDKIREIEADLANARAEAGTEESQLFASHERSSELSSDTADRINELEERSLEAQQILDRANARSRRAQAMVNQMEERGGRAPVTAPADGLIVASDTAVGGFAIAADPSRLCAGSRVREADLTSLRVGLPAVVTLATEPDVAFEATLSGIDETPVDSPDGTMYRITFSIADGEREQLAGIPVRISLRRMLP